MKKCGTKAILGIELDIYGDLNNPYYLALDIARLLDYRRNKKKIYKIYDMLVPVDNRDKIRCVVDTDINGTNTDINGTNTDINGTNTDINGTNTDINGTNKVRWFVSTSGLYDLLMMSRSDIGVTFRNKLKQLYLRHELQQEVKEIEKSINVEKDNRDVKVEVNPELLGDLW